jgi:hypothetical protein
LLCNCFPSPKRVAGIMMGFWASASDLFRALHSILSRQAYCSLPSQCLLHMNSVLPLRIVLSNLSVFRSACWQLARSTASSLSTARRWAALRWETLWLM